MSVNRRQIIKHAAGAGAATALGMSAGPAAAKSKMPLRFDDPVWNRETVARIEGDIAPGKFVTGYGKGTVHGVRDNEKVRPLFEFEIFSTRRVLRQEDQSYQRLCRELVFYRDLATGKIMDSWDNVYTGERVPVVDIANDPFNYMISEFFPDPPSYGGLNKEKPPKRPFLLSWGLNNDNTVTLDSDIHLYYPNALDPEEWPRESAGPMNRVSELFRYFMRREDVENPEMTHLPHNGVWSRVTPWLPWMLMGQAPGHAFYMGRFNNVESLDELPADLLARVEKRYPEYLIAPEKWVDPSYSSLENYARTQKPAPVK